MRILALNGASAAGAGLALLSGPGAPVWEGWDEERGAAVGLATMLEGALAQAGWRAAEIGLIAVLVGPGSFTGLRASLALAHGLALGAGADLVGVTLGEAVAAQGVVASPGRAVWCVSQARRDRVFIEAIDAGGVVAAPVARMLDDLPDPGAALIVAGDAGEAVAGFLRRRGVVVEPGAPRPGFAGIVAAALGRRGGLLAPLPVQPLYVDAPEARLPGAMAGSPG